MSRHATLSELVWPLDAADADLPVLWAQDMAAVVLDLVWRGYDVLCDKVGHVDFTEPIEQLERNLTSLHFKAIQRVWAADTGGFSTIHPGHEIPELLSRSTSNAKPPAYDLGFSHPDKDLWKWPVEAKVLTSPNALAEYRKEVDEKFIGGVAAPIVGEGGMIGYLLRGNEQAVFDNLATELGQQFVIWAAFATRPHRTTVHQRANAPTLRIHHLVMRMGSA